MHERLAIIASLGNAIKHLADGDDPCAVIDGVTWSLIKLIKSGVEINEPDAEELRVALQG